MLRTLTVTTAATITRLTTLAQLKADLGLGDDLDTYYERIIDLASDEIAIYLGREADDTGNVTLGRETISETFYGVHAPDRLVLSRWPIAEIVSVRENGAVIPRQIVGTDAVMTAADATLTSALGPTGGAFVADYVGKSITVTGAGTAGAGLTTTIASITDANTIELTAGAGTTVSGAAFTIAADNPAFVYQIKKSNGILVKIIGDVLSCFYGDRVTVIYQSGWLLPGETGRTLPELIEDACVLLCQYKLQTMQQGTDFSSQLDSVKIEGVGDVKFAQATGERANSLPFDVRSLLQKFVQPAFS